MPLAALEPGVSRTIVRIAGQDAIRAHLAELGFVVGERVQVICTTPWGQILSIKGSRVALSRDMTMRIMV